MTNYFRFFRTHPGIFSVFVWRCATIGLLVIAASLLVRWRFGATLETTSGGEEPCVATSI